MAWVHARQKLLSRASIAYYAGYFIIYLKLAIHIHI